MSAAAELIGDLEEDGVQLVLDADTLRYRAAKGVMSSERLHALRVHKSGVIELLAARDSAVDFWISVADAEEIWAPLEAGRMAALHAERIAFVWRWRAPLDAAACQVALDRMLMRHCVLRTRYMTDARGRLLAITERHRSVTVHHVDLATLGPELAQQRARSQATQLADTPFNIQTGPLLRLVFFRIAAEDFIMAFVICHSIFDGSSLPVFITEYLEMYRAATTGGVPRLPHAPPRFSDHARAVHASMAGEAGFMHLDYWRQKLATLANPPRLASDWRPSVVSPSAMSSCAAQLDGHATAALHELMRSANCSRFVCVAAATGMVAAKWGGSDCAFFWISNAGRSSTAQLCDAIGCYMGFSPLLLDFSGNPDFHEACVRTKLAYEEALPHFEASPGLLEPLFRRIRRRAPFTTPVLNYQVMSQSSDLQERLGPVTAVDWASYSPHLGSNSAISFMVNFFDFGTSLAWSTAHKPTEFTDATIAAVSEAIRSLLCLGAHNPRVRLSDLFAPTAGQDSG
jgi:hypothetical protein